MANNTVWASSPNSSFSTLSIKRSKVPLGSPSSSGDLEDNVTDFGGVVTSVLVRRRGLDQKRSGYVWENSRVLPILGQIRGKTASLMHDEFDEQTTRLCEQQLSKLIERMHRRRTQQKQSKQGIKKDKA